MDLSFYTEFRRLLDRGNRVEAAVFIRKFISSFESESEIGVWVRQFLEAGEYGHKIRHEIYRDLVFPVLFKGYSNRDSWSLYFLALTIQNCYDQPELHHALDFHTDESLLRLCFESDPEFRDVRERLLDRITGWLRYCIHEWPAGILYGMNEPTRDELEEIEAEVIFARGLAGPGRYAEFFDDVAAKVLEAKARKSR